MKSKAQKKINLKDFCKPYQGYGVVYAICTKSEVVYIGSTSNMYSRLSGHNNTEGHGVKSKSGRDLKSFTIAVIACTKDLTILRKLEQRALDTFEKQYGSKPKYNIANCYQEKPLYKYSNNL